MINLNSYVLPSDERYYKIPQNYHHNIKSGSTSVYFRDLKKELIAHINEYEIIVGCVAWLTDFDILRALAAKSTSIIVQKEDFLRPDSQSSSNWKSNLRRAYNALSFGYSRYNFQTNILHSMSVCSDPDIKAVRCVGNFNSDKKPAFPRMHNKFIVFCKVETTINDWGNQDNIVPCAVWTGSFNFTKNAGNSFENALFIDNTDIAMAYFKEYGFIAGLSEPLNWDSEWCVPEWRIGT